MDTQTIATVITSAAVGTIVATGMTMIGQFLERRARRQDLLLAKAVEIAHERLRFGKDVAFRMGGRALFPDPASLTAGYYKVLQHLMTKGDLPKDFVEGAKQNLDELEKKWAERSAE